MRYLLIAIFFLFSSCQQSPQNETTVFSGIAMTIPYKVIVGKSLESEDRSRVQQLIEEKFDEVDRIYNDWNPRSELSTLNQLKANKQVRISKKLENLLALTSDIVTLTDGVFDPTVAPLHKLWKSTLESGRVPSDEEIETISPAIGWHNIHFSNGIFYKEHDETALDLGGIAKGFCVDLITESLVESGFRDVYVEWGGEIRAAGKHPQGRPWTVFISHLGNPDPSHAIATLALFDQAIASSGDYWQFWVVENDKGEKVTYSHIVNPKTLKAIQPTSTSIASSNVRASNCTLADALATTLMLFKDSDEGTKWIKSIEKKYPNIQFWITNRAKER